MGDFDGSGSPPVRRSLKVGILDLIAKKPERSAYTRLMYPNFASIMPQAVGVWAEELGHEVHYDIYTGLEDLPPRFPDDLDILFVSALTPAAFLAYGISRLFGERGVVTVLGGPHARAYARDARNYFDYVLGLTDRPLIRDLLKSFSRHPGAGVLLGSDRQPPALPGVRERWRFIRQTLSKTRLLGVVPMIGSLGCPYRCSFCSDAEVDHQALPYEEIREDLVFLKKQLPRPLVAWHDPNFGVRFSETMETFEEAGKTGSFRFVANSSLSLLSEPNLKRLKRNGCDGMAVGIETWFGDNDKLNQGGRIGIEKVEAVAEQINLIARYIPYTQTNFIWGLDQDAGPWPFELMKKFIDLAPAAFPSHSLLTAYGDSSPLGVQLRAERRLLDVPFPFLDTSMLHNVLLKNYTAGEFYRRLGDIVQYSYSPAATVRRFMANKHRLASSSRWMGVFRSVSSRYRARYYAELGRRIETEPPLRDFMAREKTEVPPLFREGIRTDLGPLYDQLPAGILDWLERVEPRQRLLLQDTR